MARIYGLLVGIDDYPTPVPKLEGCVNDVNAIEDYLRNRLDTNQYELHLQRLTTNGIDAKPTRKAVIAGFEEHLCQATAQDVALFYFSGHGSQESAPPEFWHLEPDHMDETLVCWDSRTTDWDLADKELAYLIAQVAKNNPHIIIILDCCHSGSGTRDPNTVPEKGVRHAPADRRARLLNDFIFPLEALEAIQIGAVSKATIDEPSGWNLPQARHILLSACRDSELAREYSGDGQQRGAFSYFLLDTLNKTSGTLSYRELFKRTSALVRTRIKDQTPQLEATNLPDLDALPFLGDPDAIKPRDPFFTLKHDGKQWTIDGGAVHGLPQSTTEPIRLALYQQGLDAEQMRQSSQAIGEAEILKVLADKSIVKITPDDLPTDTVLNAVIVSLPLPALGVYFDGESLALKIVIQKLQKAGPGGRPSLYVREVNNLADAQYRLMARNNEYIITKPTDDRPLVEQLKGYTDLNARKVVQNLEHIARWTTVAELSNPESKLPSDVIKLEIFQNNTELKDTHIRLQCENIDGEWEAQFRIKLTNTHHKRLYCAILDLPEDYGVLVPPLFPQGTLSQGGIWIEPGKENAVWAALWDGNQKVRDTIPATIPPDMVERGVSEYQDVLKLIVSTAEFDATLLTQDELPPPTEELHRNKSHRSVPSSSTLNLLMHRIQNRHVGVDVSRAQVTDEWTTNQITITTVQPKDTQPLNNTTTTNLGFGVEIQPHPVRASVRLSTMSQATRDLGSHLLPPILRDHTQPFQFTASRGVDPGLSVLELKDIDANTLNTVTPEQPLKLLVDKPLGENEYVLPVAYDGEFFIPLGRGEMKDGKTEIRIERLTDPLAEKQKSLSGSIRIFFQKVTAEKLGSEFPYPILAAVEYREDGTIHHEGDLETVKRKVTSANKIVLFIHGIIGDTQSIVPCARQKIRLNGQEKSLTDIYDLVLAFDYENLNTPIGTIAEQLRDCLSAVGLGANHGKILHIIAHSMGGLVSRSFIEQKGGNQVVQHLIMLGTPNAGSPWSTVQDWAFTALTIGLNGLAVSGFPIAALGSLLGGIEAIDITLDQMNPGSDLLKSLLDSNDPGIPYTILAGNTSLIQPPDAETENKLQTFLRKLRRGAIEFPFLGQPNDIAVAVQSIKSVPESWMPQPPKEVPCNHLVYFTHADGLQALTEAVINTGILTISIPPSHPTSPAFIDSEG